MTQLSQFPQLVFAVSTKEDGPMGLSYQVAEDAAVKARRAAFLEKFGISLEQVVTGRLVHGKEVAVVDRSDAGSVIADTDGLLTNVTGIFLAVTVADCMPLFLFDPVNKAVGLVHAGWRGVTKEIPKVAIRAMKETYQSAPTDLWITVGPHICVEHYEVGSDVADQFTRFGEGALRRRGGSTFVDLAHATVHQFIEEAVQEAHVEISNECTFELKDKYFSYRRDKPEKLETMLAVIGIT